MTDETTHRDEQDGDSRLNRRSVLRATSAAAVGTVGLGAASGTATAEEAEAEFLGNCLADLPAAPEDTPVVDLTGDGPATRGAMPSGADEVLFYVHGWLEDASGGGENQGAALADALDANGYSAPVVSVLWDSNTLNWWAGKEAAEAAGEAFADWLDGYMAANPDTTVRVVGHSLGGRAPYAMLDELSGSVTSVSAVGAANDPETVCADGRFGDGIASSADAVYDFHSKNDDIVCSAYKLLETTEGVGCLGAECDGGWFDDGSTPDTYTDVDVSDAVLNHCDYFRPDRGCVLRIVDWFDDDGTDVESDDEDDDGWW
ncbi:alpha/beta hydrolase [Halorientalis pallida]|uniref:Alpha/beta hydrolase n=1 Tax=Halorientalis pallida TaxID=2479928 RepID=A0A498KQT7_9EURY|nr:alpha/beta hydrolase [Halorientalis pallida]RXK46325.1 alpha/beta hydrolase [Halorientalis pallida]